MAKQTLPTNFKDDILNASMNGKRRYNLIPNDDGTYSLEDVSTYDQVGSNFGAGNVNNISKAVNASADAGKIIDDIDSINALTQEGYIAGALALKNVIGNLSKYTEWKFLEELKNSKSVIAYPTENWNELFIDVKFRVSNTIPSGVVFQTPKVRIDRYIANEKTPVDTCGEVYGKTTLQIAIRYDSNGVRLHALRTQDGDVTSDYSITVYYR